MDVNSDVDSDNRKHLRGCLTEHLRNIYGNRGLYADVAYNIILLPSRDFVEINMIDQHGLHSRGTYYGSHFKLPNFRVQLDMWDFVQKKQMQHLNYETMVEAIALAQQPSEFEQRMLALYAQKQAQEQKRPVLVPDLPKAA